MAHDREAIKEHYNQHVTEGVSTHEVSYAVAYRLTPYCTKEVSGVLTSC